MTRIALLKELVDTRFNGSQAELARAIKRSPAQVHQWLSGHRKLGDGGARHIEITLDLPRGCMDGKKIPDGLCSSPINEAHIEDNLYISFEKLDVDAAAGHGASSVDFPEVVQRVNVLKSWADATIGGDLSRIKLITARGTSMQGTIENGDVIFVDSAVRAYSGDGVYVIAWGSDVHVKRLQKLHGGVLAIISDNGVYETEKLTAEEAETVQVCGRVLAAWSLKKFW